MKRSQRQLALERIAYVAACLALSAAYFGTGVLGLRLNAVSGFATLIWPPTGIALAAIFFLGGRYWPAIFVGAFATNLVSGAPTLVAIGIALGNTAEAAIGASLLKRAGFQPSMERMKDAFAFLVLAALLSTLVSPTAGVISLLLGGVITLTACAKTWIAWWIGDALGDLVFGSAIIVVWDAVKHRRRLRRFGETAALCAAVLGTGAFVFTDGFGALQGRPIAYMVFVPLLWAAMRFGQLGTVMSAFAMSVIAIWATVTGNGPFASGDVDRSLIFLQIFMAIVVASKLIVAAVATERLRALETVRVSNKDLEKKVAERTAELERTVARERDFTSLVSHQLRTPLTAINWMMDVIEDPATDGRERTAFLADTRQIVRQSLHTVNELLAVSRVERGILRVTRENASIAEIVGNVLMPLKETAKKKNVTLRVDVPSALTADVDAAKTVEAVRNVADNAIKYGPEGGTIEIAARRAGNTLTLTVRNGGPGISAGIRDHIFDKAAIASMKGSADNAGLGLYLSKMLVELMGGDIRFETGPQGTIFFINLPAE